MNLGSSGLKKTTKGRVQKNPGNYEAYFNTKFAKKYCNPTIRYAPAGAARLGKLHPEKYKPYFNPQMKNGSNLA